MKYINTKYIFFFILLIFTITSCSRNIPNKQQRINKLQNLIPNSSFTTKTIKSKSYKFYTIQQKKEQCKNLHIYFEGDGLAWITKTLVSEDPTPLNPMTFKLLLKDNSNCKVYIARVCQYVNDSLCNKQAWTSHRFNKHIINSTNEVINQLKKQFKNESFSFIGYSGGAAIASLVANQRNDVTNLITIAGNLNTKLWTELKNLSPLSKSLNPVNHTDSIQTLKQYHLIGENDNIIPFEITQSYMAKFQNKHNIKYIKVNASHNCCFETYFKEIIKEIE